MCGLFSKESQRYLVVTDERLRDTCSSTAKKMGLRLVSESDIEECQMRSEVYLSTTLDSFSDVKERITGTYCNRFAIRYIVFWPRHPFSSDVMQAEIERMDEFLISESGSVAPFLISNEICNWETALRFSDCLNTSTCEIKRVPDYGDLFIVFYEEEKIS